MCVIFNNTCLGKCTKEEFEGMNTFGIENYLNRVMREHPKFRQRTSDQVWLPMAKEFDQVISKIRYRLVKHAGKTCF